MSTVENNNSKKYECTLCNKNYKDKSGLWYHNKKVHNTLNNTLYDKLNNMLSTNNTLNNTLYDQNNTNMNNKNYKKKDENESKTISKYRCKKCNKEFNNYQNRWKHEKICKNDNNSNQNDIIELKKENGELKSMIIEMKTLLNDVINKNCKVHPKTLQKINKQLNGNNNTINENNIINKGTINNTYNIIALGHENLTEVFSKKEKMNILKYKYGSLTQLVEYAHFNDKYPQFKNILITNTQNPIAYKHNPKTNQFIAVKKDELLEDIVDARMCDINSFYEELEGELDEKTKEIIDKLKEQIEKDPAYRDLKKKDIKLIIYNNRKKVIKENTQNTNEIEV